MNKRILVIFVGGTICTTIKNGEMNTDEKATMALIDFYKRSNSFCKSKVEFINGKALNILSENMTTDKWNEIIAEIKEELKKDISYDGIIVAHGTDTLAYSTALFSVLLKGLSMPVIFVSSNHPIMNEDGTENENSNGVENFKYAVECIYKGIGSGVYATYKNTEDKRVYLHKGENLIQCTIYDDNFYSRDAIDITDLQSISFEIESKENRPLSNVPIFKFANKKLCDCVLKINPYIGLNYDMFDLKNVKAVLHSTYHSGTSCVVKTNHCQDMTNNKNSILYFIDKCAKYNIPFYYSPSKVEKCHNVYASVPYIVGCGEKVKILYGDTEELTFAKLLVAYSYNLPSESVENLLKNSNI